MTETDLFETIRAHVCQCAYDLDLAPDVEAILKMPMREYHFSIPVRMDDGRIRAFQAFRVQYNDARGPTKGGIRFHPAETIETIRGLAAIMTWKCALFGLPLGGAKGGVVCNPKEMSAGEVERLSRAYVQALYRHLGPERDIPAPDVYTTPEIMAWMMDEYSKIAGHTTFGAITGKPIAVGGSEGRLEATARGGWYVIAEAARDAGIDLKGATVAVQGFGNVGANAALLARTLAGARVVAVSDSRGGVLDRNGLDLPRLLAHKERTGSVVGFAGAETISNEALLELDVDILVPAALENAIDADNAGRVRAKVVAEFANGPVSNEADAILREKGVVLIPDLLCNGGGVVVSYFEMVQNLNMDHWDAAAVDARLQRMMTSTYRAVSETAGRRGFSLRQAAYTIAVRNVVEAMKARGWV
ncbi:MAG TPA: Glu/Leu/Phe/Val dehydrogenase [Methanofollis liminatans]|uniref:Glutamate dehydrogenase n=1 Tax=Methanofollis liminatans TaxID=2201 RepID=A0A831M1M5_9EURY|nr:Glu/Leu/Phe/Val dehydrogenase [Methanofollis liminatans]